MGKQFPVFESVDDPLFRRYVKPALGRLDGYFLPVKTRSREASEERILGAVTRRDKPGFAEALGDGLDAYRKRLEENSSRLGKKLHVEMEAIDGVIDDAKTAVNY